MPMDREMLAQIMQASMRPDDPGAGLPPGHPNALYYTPKDWWQGGGPQFAQPPSGMTTGTVGPMHRQPLGTPSAPLPPEVLEMLSRKPAPGAPQNFGERELGFGPPRQYGEGQMV